MTSVLIGLLAGFIGSVVMAFLMMASSKGRPGVNAMLVGRALGRPPKDSAAKMGGMLAHFLYGSIMGAVFVLGSGLILVGGSWWTNGILYGVLLFFVAAGLVMPAAGLSREMMKKMPKGQIVGSFAFHLIYGAILAAVVVLATEAGVA